MIEMKEKLIRFFAGRYGNDSLNQFLFILELIFLVLSFFTPNIIVSFLFFLVFFSYLFRSMSRNIYARQAENMKFIAIRTKITHTFKAVRKNFQETSYRHFVCPKCAQIIRVPKGKGNIEITCPNCRTRFSKKV